MGKWGWLQQFLLSFVRLPTKSTTVLLWLRLFHHSPAWHVSCLLVAQGTNKARRPLRARAQKENPLLEGIYLARPKRFELLAF